MAGPGGREVGRVSVRAVPDTSKFPAELKAQLESLERRLEVRIPTVLDAKNLKEQAEAIRLRAQRALRDVELNVDIDSHGAAFRRVERQAAVAGERAGRSFNRGFGRSIRARTALIATAVAGIVALSPQILSLAGGLAQVAGVAALIPALLTGLGASAAVAVIGVTSLAAALKDASKAPPELAATAREVSRLGEQLKSLRGIVDRRLFDGLAEPIRELTDTWMPQLRAGFRDLTDGANAFLRSFLDALVETGRLGVIDDILSNIGDALRRLAPAGDAVVRILTDLGLVGSGFLPGLADDLSDVTQRFADFISRARESGQLREWIQDGLDALSDLGRVAGGAVGILRGLIRAADNAGSGTLDSFADAIQRVSDVVNSPAFQAGLTDFFRGLNAFVAGIGTGLPALGDALAQIGPILADFLTELGPVLGQTLQELAPVLPPLVAGLADLLTALLPLIPPLASLVALVAPLAADLLTALAAALAAVVPLITGAWAAFESFVQSASFGNETLGALITLLSGIPTLVPVIIGLIVQLGTAIGQRLAPGFSAAASAIGSAMTRIGFAVGNAVLAVLDWFSRLGSLPGRVADYFGRVVAAVRGGMAQARAAAANGIQQVLAVFAGLGARLYQSGLSLIHGFANGIRAGIGAAVSAASNALTAVRNLFPFSPAKEGPFSGRGWTLYSGQAIGDALADGMLSRLGVVKSAASQMLAGASGELQFGASQVGVNARVFIGDRELTDIVRVEYDELNRETKARAGAGVGRAR